MKVTETTRHQDGTFSTHEFSLDFSKGRSQVCFSLVPDRDEPLCVKIIESGWRDGTPLFHILIEYGDSMVTDYRFGSLEYVYEKWPVFQQIWEDFAADVVVSSTEVTNINNDMDLGRWARAQSMQISSCRSGRTEASKEPFTQLKLDL